MLKLYHNLLKNKEFYFIFFYLAGGKGDEWIELYLPVPNVIIYPKGKNGVFIGYFIEGFFKTEKNRKFLQDIIKRFEKTFLKLHNIAYIERIKHPPILDKKVNYTLQLDVIYSLKDFSTILDSIDYKVSKKEEQVENLKIAKALLGEKKITDDALFDYMRFIAYDFVKANSKEALTKEYLEEIGKLGNEILGKTKETSTIRAKAKAIYNWIVENYNTGGGVNNWNYVRKTKDDKELKMTRRERALSNSKAQYEKAHKKIMSLITGMFKDDYKKKNGSWHISKIAKDLGMSRDTIRKHLKDEGLI
ncbi:MAG: hypothetical protein ABGX25_02885 [Nautiliaceae bacterium]